VAYDKSFLQRVYRLSLPASTAQLQALQNERNLSSHPFYFNNPNALFSAAGITQGSPPTAHPALHPNTPFYCGQHCLRRYTVYYSSRGSTDWVAFVVEAKRWGLMSDVREGVPRGVYMGIVCFKVRVGGAWVLGNQMFSGKQQHLLRMFISPCRQGQRCFLSRCAWTVTLSS
jgi:hypothetical protein